MESTDIVVKTAAGIEELKNRSRKLPQRLRTMLIMIDGSLSVGQLQASATTLGVPTDFLDDLQRQGLVSVRSAGRHAAPEKAQAAVSEVDRFRSAQKFMNDTVVDALGFRAFFFTLKLERCFTRSDLSALIDDYDKAILKGNDGQVARVLGARTRELLA